MPDMEKKTGGFRECWDLTAQTLRPQEKQPGRVSPKEYLFIYRIIAVYHIRKILTYLLPPTKR